MFKAEPVGRKSLCTWQPSIFYFFTLIIIFFTHLIVSSPVLVWAAGVLQWFEPRLLWCLCFRLCSPFAECCWPSTQRSPCQELICTRNCWAPRPSSPREIPGKSQFCSRSGACSFVLGAWGEIWQWAQRSWNDVQEGPYCLGHVPEVFTVLLSCPPNQSCHVGAFWLILKRTAVCLQ